MESLSSYIYIYTMLMFIIHVYFVSHVVNMTPQLVLVVNTSGILCSISTDWF